MITFITQLGLIGMIVTTNYEKSLIHPNLGASLYSLSQLKLVDGMRCIASFHFPILATKLKY